MLQTQMQIEALGSERIKTILNSGSDAMLGQESRRGNPLVGTVNESWSQRWIKLIAMSDVLLSSLPVCSRTVSATYRHPHDVNGAGSVRESAWQTVLATYARGRAIHA